MNSTTATHSEFNLLDRVIASPGATMSRAAAEEVLKWGFSAEDQQRMSELAAKARQGELSEDERAEIEEFERIGCFLGIVKSKARRSLQPPVGS